MAFERVKVRLDEERTRRPWLDHLLRTVQHYGSVHGNAQAGAVTYFAFLSFFPVMALAFFAVGLVSRVYPAANANLRDAISTVLPGIIGSGEGQIGLADVQDAAGAVGLLGLVGVLYAGLGWLSALREALGVVFDLPAGDQPSFVLGKLRDLLTLVILGGVLLVAVAVTGVVAGTSDTVLGWVGLGSELGWLVRLLSIALGLAANAVLFYAIFRLLAEPHVPSRSLWHGALLGAVLFEVLKQLSQVLLASTRGSPAFQVFGIALILVVWINYFSRIVMYAAAWAQTSEAARLQQQREAALEEARADATRVGLDKDGADDEERPNPAAAFVLGGMVTWMAARLLRRPRGEETR